MLRDGGGRARINLNRVVDKSKFQPSLINFMVVGLVKITLRLHDCRSLKGKRKVVKSMIGRIQNRFNVSAAEVGANDIHQRAEIGFAMVGNTGRRVNARLDKLLNMAHGLALAEIIDSEMEIIHL